MVKTRRQNSLRLKSRRSETSEMNSLQIWAPADLSRESRVCLGIYCFCDSSLSPQDFLFGGGNCRLSYILGSIFFKWPVLYVIQSCMHVYVTLLCSAQFKEEIFFFNGCKHGPPGGGIWVPSWIWTCHQNDLAPLPPSTPWCLQMRSIQLWKKTKTCVWDTRNIVFDLTVRLNYHCHCWITNRFKYSVV